MTQEELDYYRIEKAIAYIREHSTEQPSLEQVATHIGLSSFHFQRLFSEWVGVSPKKFLQYLRVEYAKTLLKEKQLSLFDTVMETGLSGTGRLHDLFISIEAMTPGEYKNGGENLLIEYSFQSSCFGSLLVASTLKGLCYLAFSDDRAFTFSELKNNYPNATFIEKSTPLHESIPNLFKNSTERKECLTLHIKGTPFQIKVWQALLQIPAGQLKSYGTLAQEIDNPKASRAVGSAVGDNPIAYLIPCHRVIQSSGIIGQYHWGSARKAALIGWEGCLVND